MYDLTILTLAVVLKVGEVERGQSLSQCYTGRLDFHRSIQEVMRSNTQLYFNSTNPSIGQNWVQLKVVL